MSIWDVSLRASSHRRRSPRSGPLGDGSHHQALFSGWACTSPSESGYSRTLLTAVQEEVRHRDARHLTRVLAKNILTWPLIGLELEVSCPEKKNGPMANLCYLDAPSTRSSVLFQSRSAP